MANFAHLTGCPDRAAAQRYDFKAIWAAPGPELSARYSIPLFWLAGFDRFDEVLTQWPPPGAVRTDGFDDEPSALVVLCAAARDFSARLERRRSAVLALLPAPMAPFYDEWQRFVRASYTQCLLLRTEDLFGMEGFDESAERLRFALDALKPADAGGTIRDPGVIDWFASYTTLFAERPHGEIPGDAAARWRTALCGFAYTEQGRLLWPRAPQLPEIDFAAGLPQADAAAPAGSETAANQALTSLVRAGRRPGDLRGRLSLAFDKRAGNVPLGVDAPNKTLRKFIGGGGVLLDALRNAVLFVLCTPMGATLVYLGVRGDPNVWMAGLGTLLLIVGIVCGRLLFRAVRRLRAVLRA